MAANTQSLAARLARGEESAFAELYDACAGRLHHYLTVRLGSCDRASDVLQATFMRAVGHRRRFARIENPGAYLFQIARNEATRANAKLRREPAQSLSADEWCSTEASRSHMDDSEAAVAALSRLDADDRELIEFKIYADLTFQEIAEVTGQTAATVATRYRRALLSLRPWLTKQFR